MSKKKEKGKRRREDGGKSRRKESPSLPVQLVKGLRSGRLSYTPLVLPSTWAFQLVSSMQSRGGLKWRQRKRTCWRKKESTAAFSSSVGWGDSLTDYPFTATRGHGHSSRTKTFDSFHRRDKEKIFVVSIGDTLWKILKKFFFKNVPFFILSVSLPLFFLFCLQISIGDTPNIPICQSGPMTVLV